MERVVGIIEARTGSTRLPGKVLAPIVGKPLLEHVIERLDGSRRLDDLIVATSTRPGDDAIEALAHRLGVGCFRGDEADVLSRVRGASEAAGADVIVKLSGDNPLYHPEFVDPIIERFLSGGDDFVSNTAMGFTDKWTEERTWPIGTGVSVFRTALLAVLPPEGLTSVDREHVITYIIERPERFRLGAFRAEGRFARYARPELRFAVDTADDLEFMRAAFAALYPADPRFTLGAVIALLDERPELLRINAGIRQQPVASGAPVEEAAT
jgi:spore coat polysaccharide biosynthesis protein SpsF (cytidylyltransferase family)